MRTFLLSDFLSRQPYGQAFRAQKRHIASLFFSDGTIASMPAERIFPWPVLKAPRSLYPNDGTDGAGTRYLFFRDLRLRYRGGSAAACPAQESSKAPAAYQ